MGSHGGVVKTFAVVFVTILLICLIENLKTRKDRTEDPWHKTEYKEEKELWQQRPQIKGHVKRSASPCKAPYVALTLSPFLAKKLQILWEIEKIRPGDWVGLFDEKPDCRSTCTPLYRILVNNATGWINTDVTFNANFLVKSAKYSSTCLGYWVGYFDREGNEITVSCLRTNPTWMYDAKDHLSSIKIKRLFIPGTHDSGAFVTKNTVFDVKNFVEQFVFTQDEDILEQLIQGARYLDLRVSSYSAYSLSSNIERWWINHGAYRVRPLREVIDDVKVYLRNTKEIVIMDFHEFLTGFEDDETHRKLVLYLISELSDLTAYPDWGRTCGQIWAQNKTLVISYNNPNIVKQFPSTLWNPVRQRWANAQDIQSLKLYLAETIEKRPTYPWSAMAQLTPTTWSIVTHQITGLRELANDTNREVSTWFRGNWGRTCNVVAVDFLSSTDIVQTAIMWNLRRSRRTSCDLE